MAAIDGAADVVGLHFVEGGHIVGGIEHVLEFAHQFVVVPGLGDEVGGSALQSANSQVDIGVGGDEHHGQFGMMLADSTKPEETVLPGVDTDGEVHIEQHEVDHLLVQDGEHRIG